MPNHCRHQAWILIFYSLLEYTNSRKGHIFVFVSIFSITTPMFFGFYLNKEHPIRLPSSWRDLFFSVSSVGRNRTDDNWEVSHAYDLRLLLRFQNTQIIIIHNLLHNAVNFFVFYFFATCKHTFSSKTTILGKRGAWRKTRCQKVSYKLALENSTNRDVIRALHYSIYHFFSFCRVFGYRGFQK
jgi:hypothetical protein